MSKQSQDPTLMLRFLTLALLPLTTCWALAQNPVTSQTEAQLATLTLKQQTEDFQIFRGSLPEGHGGLYYFIDKATLNRKCDSVGRTFTENATVETYSLKLRYLITLLRHGHSRVNLPTKRFDNFRLGILNPNKRYLPLQLIVLDKKLYVLGDCSQKQTVAKGSEIVRINGVSATQLMDSMLHYIPADGINTTFKYYNLYNYYSFHFLYNLFYPDVTEFTLELAKSPRTVRIGARTPAEIEKADEVHNNKAISHFDNPIQYKATVAPSTAYLKVGSFYKGFIEGFGTRYETFVDSVFHDLNTRSTKNLILDLRDNEGGGDGYSEILFSHFFSKTIVPVGLTVPSKTFPFVKYAVISDDIQGYIANPNEFLNGDGTLSLKQKYLDMMAATIPPAKDQFTGPVYVLINEGVFSAGNTFVGYLYGHRKATNQKITFIGEENGGDIYSNVLCAGQSYIVKLPNSGITADMPFLCSGTLNKTYPAKRLPDYRVVEKIDDLIARKDGVLQAAIKKCQENSK